tara:strand:- start:3005 stop:4285 length:1281 start_codon:yes stop_codon:yes gene_type:complete
MGFTPSTIKEKLARPLIELEGELACSRCPLYEQRIERGEIVVLSEGSLDADIMFIGEGPNANEAKNGHPFLGAAGNNLDLLLAFAKVNRNRVIVANMVQCAPWRYRDLINKWEIGKPKKKENIDECSPWLDYKIMTSKVTLIVPLGTTALKKFLPTTIGKAHGRVFEIEYTPNKIEDLNLPPGTPTSKKLLIMPQYHPAITVNDPKKREIIARDYASINDAANRLVEPPPIEKYTIVKTQDDWDALDREIRAAKRFCFDYETTGLDYQVDWAVGIAFSTDGETGWYIPTFDDWFDRHKVIEWMAGYLEDPEYEVIAHNANFEFHITNTELGRTANTTNYKDTMIEYYLLESEWIGLKDVALRVLHIRMTQIMEFIGKKKDQHRTMLDASRENLEGVGMYACADAAITMKLHFIAEERLHAGGVVDD